MMNLAKLLQDSPIHGAYPNNGVPDIDEISEIVRKVEGEDDEAVSLNLEVDSPPSSSPSLEGGDVSVTLRQRPKGKIQEKLGGTVTNEEKKNWGATFLK
jgi:hypothetical protein